ncbi:MAG: hypothetical protein WCE81_11185 [Halobacteriota archaeon]
MNKKVTIFKKKFNTTVDECRRFCYMTRAKEFQLEALERLNSLKAESIALKEKVIAHKDEDSANAMLSFEEMTNALINELNMWIALKDDNPNLAWDYLVEAQGAARSAMQCHDVASHLGDYVEHLHFLEVLLFPPQHFFSPGIIVKQHVCSICGQDYDDCTHIKGKAYMGKMCVTKINEIVSIEEISFTPDPANKHSRIFTIGDGDVMRDTMTWRIVSDTSVKEVDSQ